ncbi:MAG: alpha-L-fucosidase [Kiritimatiellaeota bacterium]|nr:alpha-L-fucosidase [Kiritimatiellota bacterium]
MNTNGIKVILHVIIISVFATAMVRGEDVVKEVQYRGETAAQHDARMQWWREAKFGMFITWGVYAQLAGNYQGKESDGLAEWIMYMLRIPKEEYKAVAAQFNPVKYNPDEWVRLAKEAGMRYIVITSKHHDGFALFDSKASDWNVVKATPYGKDLLKPLAEACRKHGIRLGFYYSQQKDWWHPGGGDSQLWEPGARGKFDEYFNTIAIPQVKELLAGYGDVGILWFDIGMPGQEALAERMATVVRDAGSSALINSRLLVGGKHTPGLRGEKLDELRKIGIDYLSYPDKMIPRTPDQWPDWETCMTMNENWGYRASDHKWKSTGRLVQMLIEIVSKGGTLLLNVGPKGDGSFPDEAVERLKGMGEWMKVNGEAIHGVEKSPFATLPFGERIGRCAWKPAAAGKPATIYLYLYGMPEKGLITLPVNNPITKAYFLAKSDTTLKVEGKTITVPGPLPDPLATVVAVEIAGELEVIKETTSAK